MKYKCENCGQFKMQSNKVMMFVAGFLMFIAVPMSMILAAISIVGIILEPFLLLLAPFSVSIGIILMLVSPFMRGSRCSNCGFRKKILEI